jgi:hypothetical protein
MAAPALTGDSYRGNRTRVITYSQSAANDGNVDVEIPKALASLTAHLTGTYVAGSLTIQCSNNGSTFVALPTAKTISALGVLSVAELGFRYYRFAFASMDAGNTLVLTVVAKHF